MSSNKVHMMSLVAAIVLCILLSGAGPAHAGLLVKSIKNAPSLKVGNTLPDDHKFDLPAGAEVRLELTPAGTPLKMHGPYKGTLEAYQKKCSGWLASTYAFCKDDDDLSVGGTRGLEPVE